MIILGTNSIKDTGYDVANSCRFNPGDNPSLKRTAGSTTQNTSFVFSCWVKQANSGDSCLFSGGSDSNNYGYLAFAPNGSLNYREVHSGTAKTLTSNAKYKDYTAWYHIYVQTDLGQSTASNRVRIWVNGSEITSWSSATYPDQDSESRFKQTGTNFQKVGDVSGSTDDLVMRGYMAEVVYIDTTSSNDYNGVPVTDFGEYDEDTPTVWKPKDVSGLQSSKGDTGFYLDFEDSSNLGNDVWGGTDFTEDNITATDQSTDTCTNNFATLNPLIYTSSAITYSEGNLKASYPGAWVSSNGTIGVQSGKWFWEAKVSATNDNNLFYGISICNIDPDTTPYTQTGVICQLVNGDRYIDGSYSASAATTLTTNDILGVALDLDSGTKTVKFYKNGSLLASSSSINLTSNFDNEFVFPFFSGNSSSGSSIWELNFGSPPYSESGGNSDGNEYGNFSASVPANHYCLNTKNLAEYG